YSGISPTPSSSTLSLHDALPISCHVVSRELDRSRVGLVEPGDHPQGGGLPGPGWTQESEELAPGDLQVDAGDRDHVAERLAHARDRKSTRLNSSHEWISYAVFCL